MCLYEDQISGERLHDNWSSGFIQDDHVRHQTYRKRDFQKQDEGYISKPAQIGSQRFGCQINKYAQSAIQRAKSASCKQDIANVACRIDEGTLYPKKLPRFCPIKGNKMSSTLIVNIFVNICDKQSC